MRNTYFRKICLKTICWLILEKISRKSFPPGERYVLKSEMLQFWGSRRGADGECHVISRSTVAERASSFPCVSCRPYKFELFAIRWNNESSASTLRMSNRRARFNSRTSSYVIPHRRTYLPNSKIVNGLFFRVKSRVPIRRITSSTVIRKKKNTRILYAC